ESTNVAANLTVSTTADAFILVADVKGEGDTNESGLKGTVTVTISVERGNQTFERLSLNVDGMEVDAQDFGTAAAAEDAEQSTHPFTLSFDSDGYDSETGAVDYMNGEHSIQALLKIAGRDDALMSNVMLVEFKNDNKLMASLTGLGDGAANESTGQMWYGGPDASVEISALPVVYSSGGVSSVTLLAFCGDDDAMTDSEAPFMFEVDCGGYMTTSDDGDKPEFTVGGDDIGVSASAVYLDFKAPTAPHFYPNPNDREGGWINASVGFTAEWEDEKGKRDGWLVYNDGDDDNDADDGVGGYMPQLRFAEAGDDEEVGGALAGPAHTQVPASLLGVLLAGEYSSKADEYCVVVSATDMLGNESKLPDADANCVSAANYDATDADNSAGLLAGVDLQAPTIAFSPASPKANATTMRNFQVQVADAGSGIRAMDPVTAEAHVRDADDSEEIDPLGLNVELPLATTTGLPGDIGYYTFSAEVADKAGNSSEEATRVALHDDMIPVTNTIVGMYDEETGLYSLIATVTDNLSIKAYWAEMRFAGSPGGLTITNNLFLPREGGVAVDAYNAADLTTSTLASSFMVHTYQAIQTAGDITNLTSIGVFARDNADGLSLGALGDGTGGAVTITPALALTVADNGFDITADEIAVETDDDADDIDVEASDRQVFQTLTADTDVSGGTVEFEATATGTLFMAPTPAVRGDDPSTTDVVETDFVVTNAVAGTQGLRDNPFSRVDFYAAVDAMDGGNGRTALKFIGSVNGATAGAEDFDTEGSAAGIDSRRYIYSMEMSEATFLAIVGGDEDDDYGADDDNDTVDDTDGAIIAIGVRKDNESVGFSSAAVELTVER
ncbi:MAG: hypothetical protein OXK79_07180, partial [Chloroflexota bacterium]|nr:hypothetical protein [Chloroflexota bacterium]